MIQPLGVPRPDVDVVRIQPLPWPADEVSVSFLGGAGYRCSVSRYPGDQVRVEIGGLEVPAGTTAEIEWTQNGRGGYASGTVVAAPAGGPAGVYIRIEQSVSGIERRLETRTSAYVPVILTDAYGRVFHGHAVDLSTGGAHVIADLRPAGFRTWKRSDGAAFDVIGQLAVKIMLPDGDVQLWCLVAGVGPGPGDIRLCFLDQDRAVVGRLGSFLRQ